MLANITDIKRFAVHDGDGIRTTVFFKGCPLRCLWCHNPEGLSPAQQLGFFSHKCVGCRACGAVCPVHQFPNNAHIFHREACKSCGQCTQVCPQDALALYGRKVSVQSIFQTVLEDKSFYDTSGGGVTLSGGECLCQPEACRELLEMCKKAGIRTAVDTCGYVSRESLEQVMPVTDTFLYDLKAWDETIHIQCTGVSNRQILDNLQYLDACGCETEIRIPLIPGYNEGQLPQLAAFIQTLSCTRRVRVLPYHNYAGSKYDALGMENTLPQVDLLTQAQADALWAEAWNAPHTL